MRRRVAIVVASVVLLVSGCGTAATEDREHQETYSDEGVVEDEPSLSPGDSITLSCEAVG